MSDCKTIPSDNNLQGWILTLASALACCLGASVVFSDLFFQKFLCTRYFQIVHDPKFMVASLSLGAGVMLYSSLYTLLHEAKKSFDHTPKSKEYAEMYLIIFYFLGVIGFVVINRLIHHFVGKEPIQHHCHNHHQHHHHSHNHNQHNELLNHDDSHDERTPILKNHIPCYTGCNESNCSDRLSVCIVEEEQFESLHYQDFSHDGHNSHHNSIIPKGDQNQQLMQIGIQTALAISIHKFPEGLITFITSRVSPTVGFALFIAIALHNISEGFTIAIPLYIATRSRIKSFLYASLLGGLSQPLGALIGYLLLKESELACWDHSFIYGMLFAAVSGLMSVISIQGMLPQAIKNDRSDGNFVSVFFFMGILIMGISSALFEQASFRP